MNLKKEIMIIAGVVLFLLLVGVLNIAKETMTGEVGRVGVLENPLEANEYLLYVNEAEAIEGRRVELLEVKDSGDVIVSVGGNVRSVSDKTIVSNGLQIRKSVAIKEENKKSFAVLEILKVEQDKKIECRKDGKVCYDDYYEMGVEDFCDRDYLKEYSCEYDVYVKKTHCMKETIKCERGCVEGKCVGSVSAY